MLEIKGQIFLAINKLLKMLLALMLNLIDRSDAPQQWINSYKYILDSWRLFKARAEIDNAISFAGIASNAEFQVNKNNRIPPENTRTSCELIFLYMQKPFQIYIACSYCNASICRSEHQIMKHLTVTPPGPTRPEQQRPRPVRNKRLLLFFNTCWSISISPRDLKGRKNPLPQLFKR